LENFSLRKSQEKLSNKQIEAKKFLSFSLQKKFPHPWTLIASYLFKGYL